MKVIKIGIAHGLVASIATMSIMACLGTTSPKKADLAQVKSSQVAHLHGAKKQDKAPALHEAN